MLLPQPGAAADQVQARRARPVAGPPNPNLNPDLTITSPLTPSPQAHPHPPALTLTSHPSRHQVAGQGAGDEAVRGGAGGDGVQGGHEHRQPLAAL